MWQHHRIPTIARAIECGLLFVKRKTDMDLSRNQGIAIRTAAILVLLGLAGYVILGLSGVLADNTSFVCSFLIIVALVAIFRPFLKSSTILGYRWFHYMPLAVLILALILAALIIV